MLYIILCEYYNNTWLYTIATPTLKSHWSKILLHKSLTPRISLTCSDVWMLNTGAFIHQAWHSSLQWQNASFRRNNASLLSCSNKDYSCSLSSGLFAHTFDMFVWSKALCRPPCLLSAERWPHCQPLSTPAITRPEKTELLASGRSSRATERQHQRETPQALKTSPKHKPAHREVKKSTDPASHGRTPTQTNRPNSPQWHVVDFQQKMFSFFFFEKQDKTAHFGYLIHAMVKKLAKYMKKKKTYSAFSLRPSVSFCSASAKNFHFGASLMLCVLGDTSPNFTYCCLCLHVNIWLTTILIYLFWLFWFFPMYILNSN